MPSCAAINCTNRSEKGIRLFRFPANKNRREQWVKNMRRKSWTPSNSSFLCETHFEGTQWEQNRADSWRKLKPFAVPTLFDIPNPPPRIDQLPRKSIYKKLVKEVVKESNKNSSSSNSRPKQDDINNNEDSIEDKICPAVDKEIYKYAELKKENENLRRQLVESKSQQNSALQKENQLLQAKLKEIQKSLEKCFNSEQIHYLTHNRINNWSNMSIVKGLKFRFALGVHGYNYLRESGYPLPSYSTLYRRVQEFKPTFGIFTDFLEPLKCKVASMEPSDCFCTLSYDEMAISEQDDFDKSSGKFIGKVTLGNKANELGQKIYMVIVRGIKNSWKQVIGCHTTSRNQINPHIIQNFIRECLQFVENCGLKIVALTSDLDTRNRALWTSLGIQSSKNYRVNKFTFNNRDIFVVPDVCHLLKNLKAALQRQTVYLPGAFVELEKLPTNKVDGTYVSNLWRLEMDSNKEVRRLHHLRLEDVNPSHFDKMNVGSAIRFFSTKTAAALEMAVCEGVLPKEALTTATFIRLVEEWFSLVSSKVRKTSITSRNCDRKYLFLHRIIEIFSETIFEKNWKPLNYGMILASLSFCDIAEFLFLQNYDFVLGHRFTQDAVENIFSQLRRRMGKMPSALQCLRGLKMISISQFVSDVKRTNYSNDTDSFLIDCFYGIRPSNVIQNEDQNDVDIENVESHLCDVENSDGSATFNYSYNESDIINMSQHNDHEHLLENNLENVEERINIYEFEESKIRILPFEFLKQTISIDDAKNIFYLAGSTTNAVIKNVCKKCITLLTQQNLPDSDFIANAKLYTTAMNHGNLKHPCFDLFYMVLHCNYFFNTFRSFILRNGYNNIIECIVKNIDITFPLCCDVKRKIVKHFFAVRAYCVKNFSENSKRRMNSFGTASIKRRKH